MNDERFTVLIASYFSGNIDERDQEALFSRIAESEEHRLAFEAYRAVWQMTERDPLSFEADKSVAWDRLENQLNSSSKRMALSFRRQLFRYAAVFLLLAAVGYWWYSPSAGPHPLTEIRTGVKEKKELLLPDNSRIWLNENSTLLYAEDFEERKIILEGEAFFEVERMEDSPFVIKSGEAQTVVLGTSFNVRAYPMEDIVEVTVKSGKVGFSKPGGATNAAMLIKGETAVLYKREGHIVKQENMTTNAASWKTGELVFAGTPMTEVITSLERYFNIDLMVDNEAILNCPFDGSFSNAEHKLGEVLGALEFALSLEARKEQSVYVLSGAGCL